METNGKDNRAEARKAKRKKQVLMGKIVIAVLVLIIAALCFFLIKGVLGKKNNTNGTSTSGNKQTESQSGASQTTESETQKVTEAPEEDLVAKADRLAAMYDYDAAIDLLKNSAGYANDSALQSKVSGYEATKATCVEYPLEEVTHIFYHSLVKDTKRAFGPGDHTSGGINQVMTTIEEFNKITQSMYEKGYVMVKLSDMATFDENGNLVKGKIMLPPDKKPFVLSQDDVSYYHYQEGYGMADKLVVDENGEVKTAYTEDDGSVTIGNDDMVPLIDEFVKEHPDFSYRGAKGTLAMTGYNGVFGYRTDIVYKTREPDSLDTDQKVWLDKHPDFNYDQDVADATKVAEAMKANGWTFASHTWGHQPVGTITLDKLKVDTQKWLDYVEPILGPTNIIIFAFGQDIGPVEGYTAENTDGKFEYLKSVGFDIYCNVDSSQYWVQFGDNFMRQGRRNLDGYRMYYNPELVSDLFDANSVFDKARPTPVPQM